MKVQWKPTRGAVKILGKRVAGSGMTLRLAAGFSSAGVARSASLGKFAAADEHAQATYNSTRGTRDLLLNS